MSARALFIYHTEAVPGMHSGSRKFLTIGDIKFADDGFELIGESLSSDGHFFLILFPTLFEVTQNLPEQRAMHLPLFSLARPRIEG